jgi:hypothetical protein
MAIQFIEPPKGLPLSTLKILKAVKEVEKDGILEKLEKIPNINSRLKIINNFINQFPLTNSYEIRAFLFLLDRRCRKKKGLSLLGVCEYYRPKLKTFEHNFSQRCVKTNLVCYCTIPQAFCRERDNDKPRYPNLVFIW